MVERAEDENLFNEEQIREIIQDYREKWLEEDQDKFMTMCQEVAQETCYEVFDE